MFIGIYIQFCILLCVVITNLLYNSECQQLFVFIYLVSAPSPWFFIFQNEIMVLSSCHVDRAHKNPVCKYYSITSFALNDCWHMELKRRFEITTHKRLQKCISILSNKKYRPVKSINSARRGKNSCLHFAYV